MRVEVIKRNGRIVYRKRMNGNTVFNIYCFLCGIVIAMMIAVAICNF